MTDGSIGVRHHVADARLDAIDARLDALPGGARTLAPGRARATPLAALVDSLAGPDAARRDALSLALGRVVSAEIENFPEQPVLLHLRRHPCGHDSARLMVLL